MVRGMHWFGAKIIIQPWTSTNHPELTESTQADSINLYRNESEKSSTRDMDCEFIFLEVKKGFDRLCIKCALTSLTPIF